MGPAVVGSGQRYRPAERLGEDRLGTLWRGTDEWSGAPVVVRLLEDRSVADRNGLQRATNQIRSAQRRVSNRHVARILDFDLRRLRGLRAYVVYEGFGGEPLARELERRTPVTADRALRLVAGVAEGLAAAHAAWIYHSALTSTSVLVDADVPQVIDLGLGELVARGAGPGTVPPASIRDRGPADVLAVGLLFEQLLLGSPVPPAPRDTDAPRAWEGRVPRDAADALRRALSPFRRQRPDMRELAGALASALHSVPASPAEARPTGFVPSPVPVLPAAPPVRAPEREPRAEPRRSPPGPPSGARPPRRRRRILVPIVAAAVLFGGAAAAGFVLLRDDGVPREGRRDEPTPVASTSVDPSATPSVVRATVPEVLGRRTDVAIERIEEAGLVVGSVTTVPGEGGVVVRSDPTQGEAVAGGTAVDLFIGNGFET